MLQEIIESKLTDTFEPSYLSVVNESYMHNVPAGSESHFKVVIVSEKFEGQRLIGRHRQVNQVLAEELANHIHALSMHTYTASEWKEQNQLAPDSPMCLGSSK
ncbi:transcriptional regulator BolA [Vibrio sp. Hep-1b-8]|uniref:transcriptional regulator BolA n=1 Tax=Vibrio sp. Hep-1b-8 TaxID=2144187 RepID=UPI001110BF5D|nr:transcriptional regulator BolA [Vibrio sp. Hep-1b-8]TMX31983.1 transcriptional regulator BolA [Vibrio sp. Hep-1b-8]